jgi:hypothetical protein
MTEFTSDSLRQQLSTPRNYSLAIIVTAVETREVPCPTCKEVAQNFDVVRSTYMRMLGDAGSSSPLFFSHPIVFAKCDLRKCYDLLVQARLQAIPAVIYIGPRSASERSETEAFDMMPEATSASAEDIAAFLSKKTGLTIQTNWQFYSRILYVVGTVVFLFLFYTRILPLLKSNLSHPFIWFPICLVSLNEKRSKKRKRKNNTHEC